MTDTPSDARPVVVKTTQLPASHEAALHARYEIADWAPGEPRAWSDSRASAGDTRIGELLNLAKTAFASLPRDVQVAVAGGNIKTLLNGCGGLGRS